MLKLINPVVAKEVGVMAAMVFQHICYWMQTQSVDVVYRTNKELSSDLDESVSVSQVQRAKQKLLDKGLIEIKRNPFNKFDRTTHYSLTNKGKKMLLSVAVKTKEIVKETVRDVKDKIEDIRESLKTAPNSSNTDVGGTYVPEQDKTSNTSNGEHSTNTTSHTKKQQWIQQEKSGWIPRDQYAAQMKQKRIDEQLNKEPFIPKSMIKSWEDGMKGNPSATKGIPKELLNNPKLANMLKMKRKNK